MRMLNSVVDIVTSECGLYATEEVTDKVHSWMYTFCKKSTKNDRPRAYRKALESLVEEIKKIIQATKEKPFFTSRIC